MICIHRLNAGYKKQFVIFLNGTEVRGNKSKFEICTSVYLFLMPLSFHGGFLYPICADIKFHINFHINGFLNFVACLSKEQR